MQVITKYMAALSILFTISGCIFSDAHNNDSIKGSWRLYDIVSKNDSYDDFETVANLKNRVQEGAILSIFEGGQYTELEGSGNYATGKWNTQKGNTFTLTFQNSKPRKVIIKNEKKEDGSSFLSLEEERGKYIFKYLKAATPLKKASDDPFFPDNNLWRLKPEHAESKTELSKRMAGYFKHLALLLKATKERKQPVVSFEFSKGPVQVYNSGIGIYSFSVLPDEWKHVFFDGNDAFQAYLMFEEYLGKKHYKGAGIGDWIEDDYNILLSIYADFNKPITQ